MELTKEELEEELVDIMDNCYSRIRKCIKDKKCGYKGAKVVCESYEVYKKFQQLINEHFDNPPLKFEELHEEMWVWDDKYKEYCFIYFIAGKYPHRLYIDNCQSDSEFEENRFYRKEVL